VHLFGRILANGLVEWVRTWRPDRSTAAGALGLGWAGNWATRSAAGPPGAWPAGMSRGAG
jgi:hypothetical protein